MTDMRCSYCEADQKVCHDDSGKYSESERHEHTCTSCDKNFVFRTNISFNYNPKKADCLNGEPHILELTKTWPKKYTKWRCKSCDFERDMTSEELVKLLKLIKERT